MLDTGATAFMLVSAMLVFLMTPGVAFFYGGLARRKNVVNTMFMSFVIIGVVAIVWILVGWSLAYGGDGSNPFFGGFDQLGCMGAVTDMLAEAVDPGDSTYPAIVDIAFQAAFACITAAIVGGSLAGRMKFGAFVTFITIWILLIYAPLAHMVWGGDGSFIGDQIGALDFAGGDVVHISSGLTGFFLVSVESSVRSTIVPITFPLWFLAQPCFGLDGSVSMAVLLLLLTVSLLWPCSIRSLPLAPQ